MKIQENGEAELYRLRVFRSMAPEKRLLLALELSEWTRKLFEQGLRSAYPQLSEPEFRALLRRRIDLCHNRNY